jgi:methylated-DNA-[protein]-cysteine S-methyltransferase
MTRDATLEIATFKTALGWMALAASPRRVIRLTCGLASAGAALAALDNELLERARTGDDWRALVERLKRYAAGGRDDFRDVELDLAPLTPFQRRVIKGCRAIPYGQTRSYGELARRAGSPGAARAVGNTMAQNRFSVLVPCHRVINADGSLGPFGEPGGRELKRRMLARESAD